MSPVIHCLTCLLGHYSFPPPTLKYRSPSANLRIFLTVSQQHFWTTTSEFHFCWMSYGSLLDTVPVLTVSNKSSTTIMTEQSAKYTNSSYLQKLAAIGAICSAFTATMMTSSWANGTGDGYLGGVNWNKRIFGWHPILMVAGLVFCSVTSLVAFRILPTSKPIAKVVHVVCHTAAVICLSIGFSAIYLAHNDPDHNDGQYSSSFTSIHSFVGLGAIILYGQNYVMGFASFILPVASIEWRKRYMPSHIFLGTFSFVAGCMAALTGIMEVNQCSYPVTSADTNPAEHYHLLPPGCRLMNAAGIFVLLSAFLGVFALLDVNNRVREHDGGKHEMLINEEA